MPHIALSNGITYCPDTPDNWRHFHRLKHALTNPGPRDKLKSQIAKENKFIKNCSRYLPGYGPNRL